MIIISDTNTLQAEISRVKNLEKTVGFVPTMGALHEGHLSLVRRAAAENDFCIVSIFVNPTQFNNADDLAKYPRTLERDAALLATVGCHVIFAPQPEDIYSKTEINTRFDFDFQGLDAVMEGKFRAGHFNGVVQIVSKLFALVQPDRAYFGEKDFQQLAIIHLMVKTMNLRVQIVDCPIVREPSGLAMSSRNERLTAEQRAVAANISKILFKSKELKNALSPAEVCDWVIGEINKIEGLETEYFEIADAKTLKTATDWQTDVIGCVAVYCGNVSLIEYLKF
jgi:pantoate--beta-alanine ligase